MKKCGFPVRSGIQWSYKIMTSFLEDTHRVFRDDVHHVRKRPCVRAYQFSSVQSLSRLRPHGLQHTRLPCLSLSPRVCSNSCPLSWWCYPNISSSATRFSFCFQFFPASESFLFLSRHQFSDIFTDSNIQHFPYFIFLYSGGQEKFTSLSSTTPWKWFYLETVEL